MKHSFGHDSEVKATRKSYRCAHCGHLIAAGSACVKTAGADEDGFFTFRSHPDCRELWLLIAAQDEEVPLGFELDPKGKAMIREAFPGVYARLSRG